MNPETTAFIVADAWFSLITVIGGLITGALGYRALVRRAGATATAGLVLGAVGAALLAMWVGDNIGLSTYNHLLGTTATGTFFHSSLALGAKSTLAFWPLGTAGALLLAESGSRRSTQTAARSRHRKASQPGEPGTASGMWTAEPPGEHSP